MATAHTADEWQPSGGRPSRPYPSSRAPRPDRMRSQGLPRERMPRERMTPERMAPERMTPERMAPERRPSERVRPERMDSARGSRDRMARERPSRPVRGGAPSPARAPMGAREGYPRPAEGRRPADPRSPGRGADRGRAPERGRPDDRGRGADRSRLDERGGYDDRRPGRPSENPRVKSLPAPAEARGGRLRGIVAVLGIFLVTLAGAGVDSFVGVGLGLITLVCLVAATVFGTLLVRRRDLLSVVVSPPLVFLAVTAANIGLAPSAHFNLPTLATLLVRGFPTMAIATGVAIVLALFRLAARR
jgi:hypothetical protein